MDTQEQLDRLRKNIAHYARMKKSGKLNGTAQLVKDKLKAAAKDIGLNLSQELKKVKTQPKNSSNPRENPVDFPFSITLKEIVDMHSIRSWKRLNSMLGSNMPCYTRKSWESTTAHVSVIYLPDYDKKIYNLDLLLDGHIEDRICVKEKRKRPPFKRCLEKLVDKWGDLEIEIYDQGHAKKVPGAIKNRSANSPKNRVKAVKNQRQGRKKREKLKKQRRKRSLNRRKKNSRRLGVITRTILKIQPAPN